MKPNPAHAEGVDVSGHQPLVDWQAIARTGKAFSFIKATESTTLLDHMFVEHWKNADAAGLLRGARHFFRPQEDAVAQAQFFLAHLPSKGELPPVLDVEVSDGASPAQLAGGIRVWVSYVKANFARPLIYTSPAFWGLIALLPDISASADLWVASWGTATPGKVSGWPSWAFWQYSNRCTVPGIPGAANNHADRFNGGIEGLKVYSSKHVGSAVR
ncbi:MAG: GH25 family lysozyme [Polyangiaceae bacterium]